MLRLQSALITAELIAAIACVPRASIADTITLNPSKDNTLYETTEPPATSNGLGSLFCGRTGNLADFTVRRCVLAFDIAGNIPPGSTINSVTLTLYLEASVSGDQTHALHTVLADWGEGASFGSGAGAPATPGDVTWEHRFYDAILWTNPGGDFNPSPSAAGIVGGKVGVDYTWTSPPMIADVQAWLDNPAGNFGWIMIGNEVTFMSAKGFSSRETKGTNQAPRLMIDFTLPTPCVGDVNNSGAVDVSDLVAVILGWGPCPNCAACPADVNGSCAVDVSDLVAVILAWGPCE